MPTVSGTPTELPEVELIERDGFELPRVDGDEPVARGLAMGSKTIALASIAAIVLAIAIMSRPSVSPTVQVEPSQTTSDLSPTTSIPGEGIERTSRLSSATTPVTQAIPLFDDDVPVELPGVISAIDLLGSLIVIDRGQLRPSENRLSMLLVDQDPMTSLILRGASPIDVNRELSILAGRVSVDVPDRFFEPSFELAQLAPDGAGSILLVDHGSTAQVATLVPPDWDGVDETELVRWTLPGFGLEVLGPWQGSLVVHQTNRIWLLDPDFQSTFVADGQVLSFNGAHLALLRCTDPDSCQISVGPPDQPDALMIDVPDPLKLLDHEAWTQSVSISPDGRKLGASVRYEGLSRPVVIDLEAGKAVNLADGINLLAPVAWSPDGEWLAYVYTDDVKVWNIEQNRSWRIIVNRELESLLWR